MAVDAKSSIGLIWFACAPPAIGAAVCARIGLIPAAIWSERARWYAVALMRSWNCLFHSASAEFAALVLVPPIKLPRVPIPAAATIAKLIGFPLSVLFRVFLRPVCLMGLDVL